MYTEKVNVIRVLLEHGADVGVVDASGNSSLHIACQQKSSVILELIFNYSPYDDIDDMQRLLSIRNNQGTSTRHSLIINPLFV